MPLHSCKLQFCLPVYQIVASKLCSDMGLVSNWWGLDLFVCLSSQGQSCLVLTSLGELLQLPVSPSNMPAFCEAMLASSASVGVVYIRSGGGPVLHPYNPESEVFFRYCHGLLLMPDGQLSVQLSTSPYHCG